MTYNLNNSVRTVTQQITGKGNRFDFTIKGNNTAASFAVRFTDRNGKSATFSPKGGNFDFVFTGCRERRVSVDFEGDSPESNEGCDFESLKEVTFFLLSDPDGDVWVKDGVLCQKPSLSARWQKRREEIRESYAMTHNEVHPKIKCVNDLGELYALRDQLRKENGPFDGDFIRAEGTKFVHQNGDEFVAIGANYLGINIWEPNIIRYFSPEEIDEDFAIMEKQGYNTIRFAFTHYIVPDAENDCRVSEESLLKIDVYLELARRHHLRVILVGLDGCTPERLQGVDTRVNEEYLSMMEQRFESAAKYFQDNPTILAWNIYNELTIESASHELMSLWDAQKDQFEDFDRFRIAVANAYIKRLTDAVRRGSQNHMVTCGTLQWSFPMIRPSAHPGVDPHGFVNYVDFLCPHYYPIYSSHIFYPPNNFHVNLQALHGWINYCKLGKPILLEEFGCPGGGEFWGFDYTQNHQFQFIRAVIDELAADVCGFINWPYQDTPASTDISTWCGQIDVEKNIKQAGAEFADLIKTADRSEYPKDEYRMDFAACLQEIVPQGSFGGYIRDSLYAYLEWLKNKHSNVTIMKK